MRRFQTGWMLTALLLAGCGGPNIAPAPVGEPMVTRTRRKPWSGKDFTGEEIHTKHFRIYTTTKNDYLLSHLPGFLEAAHRNHLKLASLQPGSESETMTVYMMAHRGQWAALTKGHLGRRSEAYLHIQAGGYMTQGVCVFWDIGTIRTLRVASHEGLHQLFARRFRHRLPMWAEEGLCTVAEGFRIDGNVVTFIPDENADRFTAMRDGLIRGSWIRLPELLAMDAGEAVADRSRPAVQYYGQLWALALFIQSQPAYRAGLARMIADAQAGKFHRAAGLPRGDFERVAGRAYNRRFSAPLFRDYISANLPAFEREYIAFARTLIRRKTGRD